MRLPNLGIVLTLALGVLTLTPLLNANASGFSFAVPTYYSVGLSAGPGQYAGTESTLYVRLYSDSQQSWSNWKTVSGPASGETATIGFPLSASFTDVTEVQVWEGQNDGVRLTVDVHNANGDFFSYTPTSKWLKNGSAIFDQAYQPVPITVDCFASNESAALCNKIKATCDRIHENNPSHGCGCTSNMTSCDTD